MPGNGLQFAPYLAEDTGRTPKGQTTVFTKRTLKDTQQTYIVTIVIIDIIIITITTCIIIIIIYVPSVP